MARNDVKLGMYHDESFQVVLKENDIDFLRPCIKSGILYVHVEICRSYKHKWWLYDF